MKQTPAALTLQTLEQSRQWTVEEIPVLTMTLSLPQCAAAGTDRRLARIDRYYRQMARSYERYCRHFLYPLASEAFRLQLESGRPFSVWTAGMNAVTTLRTADVWSLYVDTAETSFGEGPDVLRRGDSWNLRDGYPFALSDFFPGELLWRRRLLRHAREELLRRQAGGAALREDWKRRLWTEFNPENFYLTPEGLRFYYQMYALAPGRAGTPFFSLPWGGAGAPGPRLPGGNPEAAGDG